MAGRKENSAGYGHGLLWLIEPGGRTGQAEEYAMGGRMAEHRAGGTRGEQYVGMRRILCTLVMVQTLLRACASRMIPSLIQLRIRAW